MTDTNTLYLVRNGRVITLDRATPDGEKYDALVRTSLAEDVAAVDFAGQATQAREDAPEWLRPYTDNLVSSAKVVVAVSLATGGNLDHWRSILPNAGWLDKVAAKVAKMRPTLDTVAAKVAGSKPASGVDKKLAAVVADATGAARGTGAWWTAYRAETARQRAALAAGTAERVVVRSNRARTATKR